MACNSLVKWHLQNPVILYPKTFLFQDQNFYTIYYNLFDLYIYTEFMLPI